MALLLAGLSLVPEELLRAAKVDGAGGWQRFTQVPGQPGQRARLTP